MHYDLCLRNIYTATETNLLPIYQAYLSKQCKPKLLNSIEVLTIYFRNKKYHEIMHHLITNYLLNRICSI